MTQARRTEGMAGEEMACQYLRRIGHTILARNYRSGHLEIDIITRDLRGIHFVEVKSRMAPLRDLPENAVNYRKQKAIVRAAGAYLRSATFKSLDVTDAELFFDVVTVVFDGDRVDIRYIPQAFVPIYL